MALPQRRQLTLQPAQSQLAPQRRRRYPQLGGHLGWRLALLQPALDRLLALGIIGYALRLHQAELIWHGCPLCCG